VLYHIHNLQTDSPSLSYFCTVSKESFAERKVLVLLKSNLANFSFMDYTFGGESRNLFQRLRPCSFSFLHFLL
jgi:hypothetical protein